MSTKSHRTDYIILAGLGVLAAVVVLALVAVESLRGDEQSWSRTTRSTNVEGTLAFYTLLGRLGVPVSRLDEPLLTENLAGTDVLFLLDPHLPLWGDEASGLAVWVRAGGVLICCAEPELLLAGTGADSVTISYGRAKARRQGGEGRGATTTAPQDGVALPLARDVSEIHLDTPATVEIGSSGTQARAASVERLLADAEGLRVGAVNAGAGRIVVLADSSFLANGGIGKADNAVAAANLTYWALAQARGRRVAFDEFHFGFGGHGSGWGVMAGLLFRTAPGWAVLSLTAAGVLFLFYKGRRFGTRRPAETGRRRSKLEYVYSVGATYRAAGAHRLAFRLIFQWFRRRVAEAAGTHSSAPARDIAVGLSRRTGKPAEAYERVISECERATEGPRLPPRRLTELLSRLARIEQEVSHAHPGSK